MMRPDALIALLLIAAISLVACGGDGGEGPAEDAVDTSPLTWEEACALNNEACALFDMQKVEDATNLFRSLTVRAPHSETGWVNLGIALLNTPRNDDKDRAADFAECEKVLLHAMKEFPENPWAPYSLGILRRHLGAKAEEVVPFFERTHELDPTDADAAYRLGLSYRDMRKFEDAVRLLRVAVKYESHFAGAWYGLQNALMRLRQREQAIEAKDVFQAFNSYKPELGKKLDLKYLSMGRYANAMRHVPRFAGTPAPKDESVPPVLAEHEAARRAGDGTRDGLPFGRVLKSGGDVRAFILDEIVPRLTPGIALGDLNGDGRGEIWIGNGKDAGQVWTVRDGRFVDVAAELGITGAVRSLGAVIADVDHDGVLDIYVYGGGENVLFLADGEGKFTPTTETGGGDCVTLSAQIVDADHDGDLDVLTAGYLALPPAGTKAVGDMTFPGDFPGAANALYNNNRPTIYDEKGKTPAARFRDISAETGVGAGAARTAKVLAVDFDRDGDADIFEANDGTANRLLSNDRMWRYHDAAGELGLADAGPALSATTADVDQDARPDIFLMRGSAAGVLYVNGGASGFTARTDWGGDLDAALHDGLVAFADLDYDGDPDLVLGDGTTVVAASNDGTGRFTATAPVTLPAPARAILPAVSGSTPLIDVFVALGGGGYTVLSNKTPTNNKWIDITLAGKEGFSPSDMWSNNFGVGAFIEVAAGTKKVYADHDTSGAYLTQGMPSLRIGLGAATQADYVRVVWPDLVIQSELALRAEAFHLIEEVNRKPSSCPVLFKASADGDGFDFVTDFLGVGGLGFFMKPGAYAPPDETEVVRIGTLSARDGRLELRVAEPMEEICYIDMMRLQMVEHPADVTVHCDERLATADPAPTGRPLLYRTEHLPRRAVTRHGTETTAELWESDRIYQADVRRDRRFVGYLREEQQIALDFDAAAIMKDRPHANARLWMFVDGWVEYPYSHVNFAAWQAGVRGRSLSLDAWSDGDWKTVAPEVGYPGGMNRTMATDVTATVEIGLDRLRLRTNLEIFLDRVWLAWDLGLESAGARLVEVPFDVAELRMLGYPRESSPDGREPKLYDYQTIDPHIDWKVIDGSYTRLGDVRELLGEVDDRFVVMGHGEEIALTVNESSLPAKRAGVVRTFFLNADGWCKDMDAYTAQPDTVEPLPHHGMGDYPPPAGKEYPAARRTWIETWNTRELRGTWRR